MSGDLGSLGLRRELNRLAAPTTRSNDEMSRSGRKQPASRSRHRPTDCPAGANQSDVNLWHVLTKPSDCPINSFFMHYFRRGMDATTAAFTKDRRVGYTVALRRTIADISIAHLTYEGHWTVDETAWGGSSPHGSPVTFQPSGGRRMRSGFQAIHLVPGRLLQRFVFRPSPPPARRGTVARALWRATSIRSSVLPARRPSNPASGARTRSARVPSPRATRSGRAGVGYFPVSDARPPAFGDFIDFSRGVPSSASSKLSSPSFPGGAAREAPTIPFGGAAVTKATPNPEGLRRSFGSVATV